MQLEALKIFCDVVRLSSFSQAARENGVTQSSASQTVRQLEEKLEADLIDRTKRPMVPTRQGQIFYEGCKDILARYSDVENRVRASVDESRIVGIVRVAAIYSVGIHHLSRYVHRFKESRPKVDVRVEYLHPGQVRDSVCEDRADLGLISFPGSWPDLKIIPWRDEPMVAVVGPDHPWSHRECIDAAELTDCRMVHFSSDLAIRKAIDQYLRRHNANPSPVFEFDNIENIKRAVEATSPDALAILPQPAVAREVQAGTLKTLKLSGEELVRPIAIIHKKQDISAPAKQFLDLLLQNGASDPPP